MLDEFFLHHRGIGSIAPAEQQILKFCNVQALDLPMSIVPKKLQVSGDLDLAPLSLVQHLFHFSPTKIQLRLVESNVKKVSTRLDMVSSVPITADMHFVVITLSVASKLEPPDLPNLVASKMWPPHLLYATSLTLFQLFVSDFLIHNELVSIKLSDFAKLNLEHLLAHGSGTSFAVTKKLAIIMVKSIVMGPLPWPLPFSSTPAIFSFGLTIFNIFGLPPFTSYNTIATVDLGKMSLHHKLTILGD
ncbi:hypothetical protein Sjap_011344 [Stephania japonica]|uniref:Uncharacterized protein n=1 Tax=Stephania japonica TaxID=461633 RepID=A0AAP0JAY1_9MAGN